MPVRNRPTLRRLGIVALLACAALVAAACGSSSPSPSSTASSASSAPSGGTPVQGGTVTFAEQPGQEPNFIFPFMGFAYFSTANISMFQYLMYRPLYYFGKGGEPVLNNTLSLADPPVYTNNDTTVTVTLKPYKWANGEPLSAADVLFWMNMEKAEKANWAAYVPGNFPDNVKSFKAVGSNKVVFTTTGPVSPHWFTYNELAQITPLPQAWDLSGPGHKSNCTNVQADCASVYKYLTAQSKDVSSYATNPLWQVVDGPWHLSAFSPDGSFTMVPNKSYSGPDKPHLAAFKEAPFTTFPAEYNVIRGGASTIQVGYIPQEDLPPIPAGAKSGPNPLSAHFYLSRWLDFGFNYFPLNLNNPVAGPIFRQAYFRQALQSTVDQQVVISKAANGYGSLTTGPVPTEFSAPYVTAAMRKQAWPFSIATARKLLTSHGWTIPASGPATCTRPGTGAGECGAGVKKGQALTFTLNYASGITWITRSMDQLKSNAAQAGIALTLTQSPFDTVISKSVPCKPSQSTCSWQMGNWGAGWIYAPDFYPTGGELFATGAGSNAGSWSDPATNKLIAQTHTSAGYGAMQSYDLYLAKQAPVIYQPQIDFQETEIAKNLRGVVPQNPYINIVPSDWYYVKS